MPHPSLSDRILAILARSPTRVGELAGRLGAPRRTISSRLNELQRRGRVVRLPSGQWTAVTQAQMVPPGERPSPSG